MDYDRSQSNGKQAWGIFFLVFCVLSIAWLISWYKTGRVSAWPYFPDDAYYYYEVAKNLVNGYGLTMDGIHPTNGFHPLWMIVLLPVYLVFPNHPDTALVVIRFLIFAQYSLAIAIFYNIFRRYTSSYLSLFYTSALFFSIFFSTVVCGLEGILSFLLLATLVYWADKNEQKVFDPKLSLKDGVLGLILSLLMLSRLDIGALILVSFGLFVYIQVWLKSKSFLASVYKCVALFWPVLLMVLPYLLLNKVIFGHFTPVSGNLKSSFPTPNFTEKFFFGMLTFYTLPVLSLLGLATSKIFGEKTRFTILAAPLVLGMVLHEIYTLFFVKWAPSGWYYAIWMPITLIAFFGIFLKLSKNLSDSLAKTLAVLAPTICIAHAIYANTPLLHKFDSGYPNRDFTVAAEEAAKWLNQQTLSNPPLLAMKDSGAFSYFSNFHVVNLDGLISNFDYQKQLCTGDLTSYLKQLGVTHIAQHSARPTVDGGYRILRLRYRCRLDDGKDSYIFVNEKDTTYLSSVYSDGGNNTRFVIWEFKPDLQIEYSTIYRSKHENL